VVKAAMNLFQKTKEMKKKARAAARRYSTGLRGA
jgi:hypothetical protein